MDKESLFRGILFFAIWVLAIGAIVIVLTSCGPTPAPQTIVVEQKVQVPLRVLNADVACASDGIPDMVCRVHDVEADIVCYTHAQGIFCIER